MNVELGISTFGETTPLEKTDKAISHDERIRNLIEEVELADQVGIDAYAIGEHHRKDFAVSAPEIIIAIAAAKTKQIHLSSATTNLPTIDPIWVFEQYATIDAMAPGRIEIMAGRGSFTEAFDLFGYDLDNYDELCQPPSNMPQLMQWLLEELKLWLAADHLLKLLTYLVMILIIMMNYVNHH